MRIGHLQFDSQSLGIALAAVVGVVVALVVIRRLLGWALGPVFVFETTRLARKGHTFWLRVAFALGMLALLYSIAPSDSIAPSESDTADSEVEDLAYRALLESGADPASLGRFLPASYHRA